MSAPQKREPEWQRMQDELQRQRQILEQQERLAVLRTPAAGLAHEINNPIGIVASRMAQGTGLGLSRSYGIVQGHRGMIDVEAEPGRGTTFILSFPALGGTSGEPASA